ncbi:MAG: hypothetical protein WC472_01585 [Candidatus Paceibacterota bacterium]
MKYKVLKPIFLGERVEKDKIIDLDPKEAANIGEEYLSLVGKKEKEDKPFDIETAEKKAIVAELTKLGAEFKGNASRDNLAEVYKEFIAKKAEDEEDDDDEDGDVDDLEDEDEKE